MADDGYDLARLAGLRQAKTLGAINPTAHHEETLRRIVMLVIRHYQAGETEILESFLSAVRLGMPEIVQLKINQLRVDVELPQREAVARLNQWAQDVGAWHGKRWQARVMAGVNIDVTPLTRSETIAPALEKALADNAALIKDVSDDTADRIAKATQEAFETGEGAAGLKKKLQQQFGYSRRRADLIANDQLGKLTGNLDRLRHTEAGLPAYEWITVGDERVRPHHEERDGEVFLWKKPPDDGHPGEPIRCLPASAVLDLTQGGDRFWRRLYRGPMVSVVTHQGRHLQATPNHPVLTQRGWIAIGDVQQGDHLVHCRLDQVARGPHEADKTQARIGDLFEALARADHPLTAGLTDFDFHGDVSDHEVDVVNTDRLLSDHRDSKGAECLSQLLFSRSYSLLNHPGFDIESLVGLLSQHRRGAVIPHALMGVLHHISALLDRHAGHSDHIGSRPVADGDAVLQQHSLQSLPANPVLVRQLKDTLAGDVIAADRVFRQICAAIVSKKLERRRGVVAGDEMLAKRIRAVANSGGGTLLRGPLIYELDGVRDLSVSDFSDHVFNLQTVSGWYTANGLVVHNCRCRARAVIPGMNRKGKTPR